MGVQTPKKCSGRVLYNLLYLLKQQNARNVKHKVHTCVELVMVLSAKIIAQSFTVDVLSNAP